jgi:arylsulfatase A
MFQQSILIAMVIVVACLQPLSAILAAETSPNFLVFFCDNLGYGDIGPYGSTIHRTPNLDALATQSRKFTHFYTAANVCTPSRAGLMTGTYPRRIQLHMNARRGVVLQPGEPIGLNPSEVTVAEVLKSVGYATMLIGKWHLGDQPVFLPTRQGFDQYWGIPYSDDMTPRDGVDWPPLPLMRNERVIEAGVDRNELTKRETDEAKRFITEHQKSPFFLIISHAMPGSTRAPFSSEAFRGRSRNGPYGDAVEELDWSAGEVLKTLKELGLEDSTLVVWTSDNAATRRNPPQGSNAPLSGYMNSPAEGGMRVPFLARWPKQIPAGTECTELATMMDLLPTFAKLAKAKHPDEKTIDGKDIWPLLSGAQNATTPHEAFFYYHLDQLQAVRSGPWKLYFPLDKIRQNANVEAKVERSEQRLYHLLQDAGEKVNVAEQHSNVVERLKSLADAARQEIGDLDRPGRSERPAGWVFHPQMQRIDAK